jgi:hypothetical protein
VTLGELAQVLTERCGASYTVIGDPLRPVRGVGVDEQVVNSDWVAQDEVAVTAREYLEPEFLRRLWELGVAALIWRTDGEFPPEIIN